MKADVYFEFAKQLSRYMSRFGLYQIDMAALTDTNVQAIENILNNKRGLVLKTADTLAGVFNRRYYELGNPSCPLPGFQELPPDTRNRIEWRRREGPPQVQRYQKLDLNAAIRRILRKQALEQEFVASEIFQALPKSLQNRILVPAKISDRLLNEFSDYVEKTGNKKTVPGKRGRKEEFYRLIKKP